ncbi:unnamed protein product [Linum tenue]|uniref:Uncharacterized protein n=1 Tax=Linum tenue TaxID=586396 RepID=A0AAV0GXN5_9ROSI|nr:unnamed protein product [Linum tenue]
MASQIGSRTSDFDRKAALKAFDETKTGVKSLVDAGITTIPPIFLYPQHITAPIKSTSGRPCVGAVGHLHR